MRSHFFHRGLTMKFCLILGVFFLPAGCGWFNTFGHMAHSPVLMEQYREKQLPNQLIYFYCGRENLPYAVVGIDPGYTFISKFWFPVESGIDLYTKIDHLSNLEPSQDRLYAKTITGPSGNAVGVWFSFYHSTGVVVDDTNHTVKVFNPYKPESMLNSF